MVDKTIYSVADLVLTVGVRILLWFIVLWLEKQIPFIRHIDEDELWYYRYPSVTSYVTKPALYSIIFGVPAFVFLLQFIQSRSETSTVGDIANGIYGLSLAYGLNAIFTTTLKLCVGRPRPNFYLRCFPDGYGTDIDNCTGEYQGQMDGRKSFPSAHASLSFTGMVYITLHIFRLLDLRKARFARGLIITVCCLPIMIATIVATSRTCDYHHHYSDVIGGAMLGTGIAFFTHYFFTELDDDARTKLYKTLPYNLRNSLK